MKKQHAIHELDGPNELIENAKELMAATANLTEEKVVEARKRLGAALDEGRHVWETVQEKAVAGAKAADKSVRDHPYQFIGIAFGVGALVGFLLSRRN